MTRRVVTTRRADGDIEAALEYYLAAGADEAAMEFVDALEAARDIVARHPSIGSARYATIIGIAELRTVPLPKFSYVLFYTDDADAIRVHRVLHTSRDIAAELDI